MKLLLIEDSEKLRKSLSKGLTKLNYAVESTGDGQEGLDLCIANVYDIVILDLMLPTRDGMSVLRELRRLKIDVAVLILSAKNQVIDRVDGLNLGADDYLCKPFSFDELEARISSLVRRIHNTKSPLLEFGVLTVDTSLRQAYVNSKQINLGPKEYGLLEYLCLNPGRVFTYQNIEDHIYVDYASTQNAIEAHASSLRKKLKAFGIKDFVKTRRGFGYYIEKPTENNKLG